MAITSIIFVTFLLGLTSIEVTGQGVQVTLDRNADRFQPEWTRVACFYGDNGIRFWAHSCHHPDCIDGTNAKGCSDPELANGIWKPCYRNCEIRYYGGMRPKPNSVTFRASVTPGSGSAIVLSFKRSPNDKQWTEAYRLDESSGWEEIIWDMTPHPYAFVLQITIERGNGEDMPMIDKISVNLPN